LASIKYNIPKWAGEKKLPIYKKKLEIYIYNNNIWYIINIYQNKFKEKIGGDQVVKTKICGALGSSFLFGIINKDFNQELLNYWLKKVIK